MAKIGKLCHEWTLTPSPILGYFIARQAKKYGFEPLLSF